MPFPELKHCTVFIGEDHVAIADLLVALVTAESGFEVVGSASDGREVCTQCTRLKPNLLILDIELPVLNGIEVITRLADGSPETRILLFTGTTQIPLLQAAIGLGVRGIVRKTQRAEILLEALHSIAGGHSYFEGEIVRLLQTTVAEPSHGSLNDLTARELDVFRLVAEGRSNKEVALELGISVKTTETHRKNLMQKLGTKNTADLTREAFRLGVLMR